MKIKLSSQQRKTYGYFRKGVPDKRVRPQTREKAKLMTPNRLPSYYYHDKAATSLFPRGDNDKEIYEENMSYYNRMYGSKAN